MLTTLYCLEANERNLFLVERFYLNGKYGAKYVEDTIRDVDFGIEFVDEHKAKLEVRRRCTT